MKEKPRFGGKMREKVEIRSSNPKRDKDNTCFGDFEALKVVLVIPLKVTKPTTTF